MTQPQPVPALSESSDFPVERDWDIALKTLVDMATSDRSNTSAYLNLWSDITRRLTAAAPPSGRAACSTCGETGVDHDGFACRDCDGQGSTPIAAPPSGQVAFTDDEWTCVLAALKITVATCGATDCSDCRTLKSAIDKIPAARKGATR